MLEQKLERVDTKKFLLFFWEKVDAMGIRSGSLYYRRSKPVLQIMVNVFNS